MDKNQLIFDKENKNMFLKFKFDIYYLNSYFLSKNYRISFFHKKFKQNFFLQSTFFKIFKRYPLIFNFESCFYYFNIDACK